MSTRGSEESLVTMSVVRKVRVSPIPIVRGGVFVAFYVCRIVPLGHSCDSIAAGMSGYLLTHSGYLERGSTCLSARVKNEFVDMAS